MLGKSLADPLFGPCFLDPTHIHHGCCSAHDARKLTEFGDGLFEALKGRLLGRRSFCARDNLDCERICGCVSEDYFRCKSRAPVVIPRKRSLCESFEYGAFACWLIVTNHKLRERQDAFEATFANLSHSIKDSSLLLGLEVFE